MSGNKLTPKQRFFIQEYLQRRNATKAAIAAGYSAKTARSAGSRLLTFVAVSNAIEKGIAEQLDAIDVNGDVILQTLRRIAFADILDGPCTGKLRALELLGKSRGLFQKQSEPAGRDSELKMQLDVPNHSKNSK